MNTRNAACSEYACGKARQKKVWYIQTYNYNTRRIINNEGQTVNCCVTPSHSSIEYCMIAFKSTASCLCLSPTGNRNMRRLSSALSPRLPLPRIDDSSTIDEVYMLGIIMLARHLYVIVPAFPSCLTFAMPYVLHLLPYPSFTV